MFCYSAATECFVKRQNKYLTSFFLYWIFLSYWNQNSESMGRMGIDDLTPAFSSVVTTFFPGRPWMVVPLPVVFCTTMTLGLEVMGMVVILVVVPVRMRCGETLQSSHICRKNILMRWISDKTPTIWMAQDFNGTNPTGICSVNGQPGQFYNVWKPYINNRGIDLSTILWKSFPIHVPQVSA